MIWIDDTNLLGTIKSYLTINENAVLARISKKWHKTYAIGVNLVLKNIPDDKFDVTKILKNINKFSIKSIQIYQYNELSPRNIKILMENVIPYIQNLSSFHLINSYPYTCFDNRPRVTYLWRDYGDKLKSGCIIFIKRDQDQENHYRMAWEWEDVEESQIWQFDHNIQYMDKHLFEKIMESKIQLMLLGEHKSVTQRGYEHLAKTITKTNLKYLNLRCIGKLTDHGLIVLMDNLKGTELEFLNLEYCKMTDSDLEILSFYIKHSTLKHVNLSHTAFWDISPNICANEKLQKLDLGFCNKLTSVGFNTLLKGLDVTKIMTISFNMCANFTDNDAIALITALKKSNMRHLNICNYKEVGFNNIFTLINHKLQKLYLALCDSSCELLDWANKFNVQSLIVDAIVNDDLDSLVKHLCFLSKN